MLMDFRNAYKAPYRNGMNVYIFCSDGTMAFTVLDHKREDDLNRVVSLLNYEDKFDPFKFVGIDEVKTYIGVGDDEETAKKPFLMMRGWGHLVGVGGLHLSTDKTKQTQKDFFDFVTKKLKEEKIR